MKNYLTDWNQIFITQRPFLMSFAFRMTGSLTEAEDIVQDTFLSCTPVNPAEILNHKSWLTKVCSNKALDYLKKAQHKRETYPGVWLPDAIPDSYQFWGSLLDKESADTNMLQRESLTTPFLLLMQKMSSEERVVYLLNEVFEYSFKEISEYLNKNEETCRKIAQRARRSLETVSKFRTYDKSSEEVVKRFFDIMKTGTQEDMDEILAEDSELWADGGGKVSVISDEVIADKNRISRFFSLIGKTPALLETRAEFKSVNGLPGLIVSRSSERGWIYETIYSFGVIGNTIHRIFAQRNPDKLKDCNDLIDRCF